MGNLSKNETEESLKKVIEEYGKVGTVFFGKEKMFAFVNMETRAAAEKAKRALSGAPREGGRPLYVRYAAHAAAVKVSGLNTWVTNELLATAFAVFGDIERCVVYVDDRGYSKEHGIVEFERKSDAIDCVKKCTANCFFLTSTIKPVEVELAEVHEDDDGFQEKMLHSGRAVNSQQFRSERQVADIIFLFDSQITPFFLAWSPSCRAWVF